MKIIKNLKSEHITGLSGWFWIRENFAFINYQTVDMLESYRHTGILDYTLRDFGFLLLGMPFGYCLGFIIGPWLRLRDAKEAVKEDDSELWVYNKNNIAYFTVLTMLSGEHNET